MKIDDNLSQVFDIEPVKETQVITASGQVVIPEHKEQNEQIDYDYTKTRKNLHDLLATGQEALMHALEVAKSSEHPRAFEVVGNLMNQLADINEKLLKLSERKQKLDAPSANKPADGQAKTVTNNNAIFVGSTSELNKIINNMNKGE